jgi:hypothetical protein
MDDSSASFLSSEDLLLVSFSSFLSSKAFSSASFSSFFSRLSFSVSLSFDNSLQWIASDSFDFTLRLKAEEYALLLFRFGDFEADLDEAVDVLQATIAANLDDGLRVKISQCSRLQCR